MYSSKSNLPACWARVAALSCLAIAGLPQAQSNPAQGTWTATLLPRDLNHDGKVDAYYDITLNLTWLRDANAIAGTAYDSAATSSASDGLVTWDDAQAWVAQLNLGGQGGWRLPSMIDTGAPGCDFSWAGGTDCGNNVQTRSGATVYSELATLYHLTLGNLSYCAPGDAVCAAPQPGWGLSNVGPFAGVRQAYWSGLGYAPDATAAWGFVMTQGGQGWDTKTREIAGAWAVHAGDVAAVPEPGTWTLFGAGLSWTLLALRRGAAARG